MSRLLDLMTLNPTLQTWLREEIVEALSVSAIDNDGILTLMRLRCRFSEEERRTS